MDNIMQAMKRDMFAQYIGIELVEAGGGRAVGTLQAGDDHVNGLGIVHGGAIFSLADTTFAAASNSREGTAVAVNVSITFCKAAQKGKLTAVAKEVSLNRKLATYVVEVFDGEENLVALFQGTVYRKE